MDRTLLASYELGRSMVRFHVGFLACKLLEIAPWWLADGVEPRKWPVFISADLRQQIPPRLLFSEAYDRFLKEHLEGKRRQAEQMTEGLSDLEKDEIRDVFPIEIRSYDLDTFLPVLGMWLRNWLKGVPSQFLVECAEVLRSTIREFADRKKRGLDNVTVSGNNAGVRSRLSQLLKRLNAATEVRGKKAELTRFMEVTMPRISEWLSGSREPGGESTLRLLEWVQAEEAHHQKKSPGSDTNTARAKAQPTKSSHEKRKPDPPKGSQ